MGAHALLLLPWLLLEHIDDAAHVDGAVVVEDAEVHALKLVALDELGEALAAAVPVKADEEVSAACVGDTAVGLEELEGEAGAHGVEVRQVQRLHEEGRVRGGPRHVVATSHPSRSRRDTSNIINIFQLLRYTF
jgi:hypothetical protein